MQNFHNILFVSKGNSDQTEGLKQALWLANENNAAFKVLIICPEFPDSMSEYKEKFEASIREQFEENIDTVLAELKISNKFGQINIELEFGEAPAVRMIRQVLRNGHDLLIKDAEKIEMGKGFKSMDMELLRMCPCPVWLCRKIIHPHNNIYLAAAIDPENDDQVGHDLSLRLLMLSRSLADRCNKELKIISCWDYELEDYLRNSVWVDLSEEELQEMMTSIEMKHLEALNALINESHIDGKIRIEHIRGAPDQIIPGYVSDKKIDLLVMGTVARTGIQGFLIGNTAENIVQKIGCSLLALKPNGFISPVKAY